MKKPIILILAALLASAVAVAQNSQELPSAPSATRFPAAAPQPKAAQPVSASQQASPAATPEPEPQAKPTDTEGTEPASKPSPVKPMQDMPEEPPQGMTTIVKNVSLVNVIFTVTDKHGHFIKDLKQQDLRILDNNLPPASIASFHAETDLPLRAGLLIDSSNSIRDRFHFEQESAIEFLNQIIRPKSDRAFVIGFDSTAEVTQDYTDNVEKLAKGVSILRPGGGTALFDAIYFACRDKLANTNANGPVRRAIIVLSDGDDNQSRVTREEAIEMAQRAEVIIYAISTNISNIKSRGDKVLERFAETTGGRVFFPYKLTDVANAFSEIQDELRSQYAVAYKPANFVADGSYRSISMDTLRNKNLKVRARRGYYAPKQGAAAPDVKSQVMAPAGK